MAVYIMGKKPLKTLRKFRVSAKTLKQRGGAFGDTLTLIKADYLRSNPDFASFEKKYDAMMKGVPGTERTLYAKFKQLVKEYEDEKQKDPDSDESRELMIQLTNFLIEKPVAEYSPYATRGETVGRQEYPNREPPPLLRSQSASRAPPPVRGILVPGESRGTFDRKPRYEQPNDSRSKPAAGLISPISPVGVLSPLLVPSEQTEVVGAKPVIGAAAAQLNGPTEESQTELVRTEFGADSQSKVQGQTVPVGTDLALGAAAQLDVPVAQNSPVKGVAAEIGMAPQSNVQATKPVENVDLENSTIPKRPGTITVRNMKNPEDNSTVTNVPGRVRSLTPNRAEKSFTPKFAKGPFSYEGYAPTELEFFKKVEVNPAIFSMEDFNFFAPFRQKIQEDLYVAALKKINA